MSSLENKGIKEIWESIEAFTSKMHQNDHFLTNRKQQALDWMQQHIEQQLLHTFHQSEAVRSHLAGIQAAVNEGQLTPPQAAERLLGLFFGGSAEM